MNKTKAKSAKQGNFIHRDTDFALKLWRIRQASELTSSLQKVYARKGRRMISFDTANHTMLASVTHKAILRAANRKIINSFRDLQPGWNGGSGEPVPDSVIDRALRIVLDLSFQSMDIFPTGRKSIQLEFDRGSQSLEVEISDTNANVLRANDTDETYQEQDIGTDEEVVTAITRFHEPTDR